MVKIRGFEFGIDKFKYLGIMIMSKVNRNLEIDHRIEEGHKN